MRAANFGAAGISLCSGLQFCVAPQVVPTAAHTAAGQPGLLRPGRTCFVTSARTGYANRPKSGNWRYKDFHLARSSALSAAPSLVCGLFSATSAGVVPPLFGCFVDTTPQYDSPPSCMGDLPLIAFSPRPAALPGGQRRGLPVLALGVSLHAWGLRLRGAAAYLR